MLRILLLVNGLALMGAFALAASWQDIAHQLIMISALLQPLLLCCMLLLYVLNPFLRRLPYWHGVGAILLMVMAVTLPVYMASKELVLVPSEYGLFHMLRYTIISIAIAAMLLAYFRMRTQALSPILHEARLKALQARIRPHFLFNCINAVLGIVRSNPKRAEVALEDMADLFRAAMAHSGDLVAARREIDLARHYLALEKMRMRERLMVDWHIEDMPEDALMPPLMLQPLLENAVYHGIESLAQGGVINIWLYRKGGKIHIEVHNPREDRPARHEGNRMALSNIRERLALQFDVEANYAVELGRDFYHVHIMLPYIKEKRNEYS